MWKKVGFDKDKTMDNDGTNELFCPNNLIKYLCLPSHGMDEEKQTINEKLQCLEQLLISC